MVVGSCGEWDSMEEPERIKNKRERKRG